MNSIDTTRPTASTITDEQLDNLYAELDQLRAELDALKAITDGYCPECGRGDCSPTADQYYEQYRRADHAEARVHEYENAITWETRCLSCARLLDTCREAEEARDLARDVAVALENELAETAAPLRDARHIAQTNIERVIEVAFERDQHAATIVRVRALADDMRTWCSPHSIAVDYADRINEALNGPAADRT